MPPTYAIPVSSQHSTYCSYQLDSRSLYTLNMRHGAHRRSWLGPIQTRVDIGWTRSGLRTLQRSKNGAYCSAGLRVITTSRNVESMEELREMRMSIMALDVTNFKNIRKVRDDVAVLTSGKLDILVNNAYVDLAWTSFLRLSCS